VEQSSPSITYIPRPDATPEAEWAALAALYRFVLFNSSASKEIVAQVAQTRTGSRAKKEAACPSGPDNAVKGSKDDRTTPSKPERP
jgi:hypothetical protein